VRLGQPPELVQQVGPLRPGPRPPGTVKIAYGQVDLPQRRPRAALLQQRRRQRNSVLTCQFRALRYGNRPPQVPCGGHNVPRLQQRSHPRPLCDRQGIRVAITPGPEHGRRAQRPGGPIGQPQRLLGLRERGTAVHTQKGTATSS
jgi:hypothetical protein